MKARLIKNTNQRLVLLCNDGTIAAVNKQVLYDLLTDFRRQDNYFTGKKDVWNNKAPDMSMYPGETIAYITDDSRLVIHDFEPFMQLLDTNNILRDFISCAEFAQRNDKSVEIIKVFCRQGRIPGAKKIGRSWLIPENAEYPVEPERQKPNSGNFKSSGKNTPPTSKKNEFLK